jgi:hypothetical protein
MSSIFFQNFSSIDDDHKELSLSKGTDFKTKTKTLNVWISFYIDPNDMKFLSHIFLYHLYDHEAIDPKKLKQRRYDQKTRFGTEFLKAHNSHKTYSFLLKI